MKNDPQTEEDRASRFKCEWGPKISQDRLKYNLVASNEFKTPDQTNSLSGYRKNKKKKNPDVTVEAQPMIILDAWSNHG